MSATELAKEYFGKLKTANDKIFELELLLAEASSTTVTSTPRVEHSTDFDAIESPVGEQEFREAEWRRKLDEAKGKLADMHQSRVKVQKLLNEAKVVYASLRQQLSPRNGRPKELELQAESTAADTFEAKSKNKRAKDGGNMKAVLQQEADAEHDSAMMDIQDVHNAQNAAAIHSAKDLTESKAKLQLSRRDIVLAKLAIVRKAAAETPEKPVKEVWDDADRAHPTPSPSPSSSYAAPADMRSIPPIQAGQSLGKSEEAKKLERDEGSLKRKRHDEPISQQFSSRVAKKPDLSQMPLPPAPVALMDPRLLARQEAIAPPVRSEALAPGGSRGYRGRFSRGRSFPGGRGC